MPEETTRKEEITEQTDDTSIQKEVKDQPDQKEEQHIPYSRFKEVNEKLKAIEREREEEKAKAEAERLARLPDEERLKAQAGKVETYSKENSSLKAENEALRAFISERADAEIKALSSEDRGLVKSLAGDDPQRIFSVISELRKAGKIGGQKPPPVDRTRVSSGNSPQKPSNWNEATRDLMKDFASKQRR